MRDVNVGLLEAMRELGQLLGKSEDVDPIIDMGYKYLENKGDFSKTPTKKKITFKARKAEAN